MSADANVSESDPTCEFLCGKTLGDYQILRRVGGGATSNVFLAKQLSLGRYVALKILKDELSSDETYVKRFLQEARSAARLEHPNIVRIYEVGELVDSENAENSRKKRRRSRAKTYRFIAQEFVDGMSLAQYLRRNGTTTILQTFGALEQIASALKCASDRKIVHRDVKPENVLIDSAGVMKVVDFGLARVSNSGDTTLAATSLTRTGIALGTPLYMSPEQARGQDVDSRSDVYSLGVTAYRALTGVAPFCGETHLAVVLKHLNERPRPITELRKDVPKGLADLVLRMLEKDPGDRPASMDVLLDELRALRREYVRTPRQGETFEGSVLDVRETERSPEPKSERQVDELGQTFQSSETTDLGFFQSDAEREEFQRALHTTSISREWQANVAQLDERRCLKFRWRSRKNIAAACALLLGAFLLGGACLFVRNAIVFVENDGPPLTIQRQGTVEEQYVFALQLGTVDAWASVGEYFPDEEYWVVRSSRQLALAYVEEGNVEKAEEVFSTLASKSSQGTSQDWYCVVGFAWVAASKGDFEQATSTLSDLNDAPALDGISTAVLTKTEALFQKEYGNESALLNVFDRFLRRNSSQSPFGGMNDNLDSSPRSNSDINEKADRHEDGPHS